MSAVNKVPAISGVASGISDRSVKSKKKAYALFESGLLKVALTDKINDREMFMKGIDYSYYYEEDTVEVSGENSL